VVPASVTTTALMGVAGDTVTEFGAAVLLVAGLSLGLWGVNFLIRLMRRSYGPSGGFSKRLNKWADKEIARLQANGTWGTADSEPRRDSDGWYS